MTVSSKTKSGLLIVETRKWSSFCLASAAVWASIAANVLKADEGWQTAARVVRTTLDLGPRPQSFRPMEYRTAQWYGSTFWSGPGWTRVGKDWQHPGKTAASVRKFLVPRAGHIVITGRVFKRHLDGDGIVATIRHNSRELWRTELDGKDAEGTRHRIRLAVQRGDEIRFAIHKRGQIYCDTTGWDPTIEYDDGAKYPASTAFEAHKQGHGGWWYEWEMRPTGDGESDGEGVVVSCFSPTGLLMTHRLRRGAVLELTDRDAASAFVVALPGRDRGWVIVGPSGRPFHFRVQRSDDFKARIEFRLQSDESAARERSPLRYRRFAGSVAQGWQLCGKQLHGIAISDPIRPARAVPLSLWAMVQQDWRRQDRIDGTQQAWLVAAEENLVAARKLLANLRQLDAHPFPADLDRRLDELSRRLEEVKRAGTESTAAEVWLAVRAFKRAIALSNPLLGDTPLIVCQRKPPAYSHLVGQYFGWRQRPGGGLFVLDHPGYSVTLRDVLQGRLPAGNILEPQLSYDGKRILFSFVECSDQTPAPESLPVNEEGDDRWYFHLYQVNVDGTGLRQLTSGPYDDMMGEYLPDGDIVFCSTRRQGYSRCFGPQFSRRWHSYTLHRMQADGNGIRRLSHNDVNEWFPRVANDGRLLFARWDYIDRDAVTHQNLWSCRPDGSDPVAEWGNALNKPHCTFQVRPIPGSTKLAFIASAHHAITAGPLCLLDPSLGSNVAQAVTRITPGKYPEAESREIVEYYESPWPLSEEHYLVAYSPYPLRFEWQHNSGDRNPDNALGIYLIDSHGNRELIYRDPSISTTSPIPLRPRKRPPILPSRRRLVASGRQSVSQPVGEMIVADVYDGLGDVVRGTIESIRVVQLFPKTTPWANVPRVGVAGEENARAILGTVPVESDGSARFLVPAGKPILLQLLDRDGMAFQTMRSSTYVQPGERVTCVGCHAGSKPAPRNVSQLKALQRPASRVEPGVLGGRPFSFAEVVQPVLDRHCTECHGVKRREAGVDLTGAPYREFTRSYWSLCIGPIDGGTGKASQGAAGEILVPRFPQRNQIQVTPPGGRYGARGSRLIRMLREGHEGVVLSSDDLRRLAAWIDLNAIFYGVYEPEQQERQRRGERVGFPRIQ